MIIYTGDSVLIEKKMHTLQSLIIIKYVQCIAMILPITALALTPVIIFEQNVLHYSNII